MRLGADLSDVESIKETITAQEWAVSRKPNAVDAYTSFLQMQGKTWTPPIYRRVRKLPFILTEAELDQLIAVCSKRLATFLQLPKETGMRCGEACELLKWTDIDSEQRSIKITPEKGSNPRMFKISNKLRAMLTELQRTATSGKVFPRSIRNQRRIFLRQRKKLAARLKNPRIEKMTFHTFRHFKATMEYHKTKDILHVMRILGHKCINNTLIYTHLVDFKDDEYIVRVAHNIEEDKQLIEAGFQYVTNRDNFKIHRKRK